MVLIVAALRYLILKQQQIMVTFIMYVRIVVLVLNLIEYVQNVENE